MTKHLTNNSVLKRASLFENRNLEQSTSGGSQRDVSSIVASAAVAAATNNNSNNLKEVDPFQDSIKANLNTFKKEYSQLYPTNKLPFLELHSLEETKQLNTSFQDRIKELRNELNRTEFVATFLDDILARSENNSAAIALNDNNKAGDTNNAASQEEESEKSDAIVSKEQYVTVITLNDNTYGEIQKQKSSPKSIISVIEATPAAAVNGKDSSIAEKAVLEKSTQKAKEKAEPIYLNTLESNKTQEKVAKKRPPTPPRKPKFNNASLKLKGNENSKIENQQNKSASLGSMQQRKFSGPTQKIEDNVTNHENQKAECVASVMKSNSDSNKDGSKHAFLRTFSVEQQQQQHSAPKPTKIEDQTIHESESSLFKDYDNIYDTVTVDSDCDVDSNDGRNLSTKDDETSSHEMLSRSSSTEEGLSNYVNIDYFLRKNSLGRSNSNLPSKLMKYPYGEDEPEDETNLSSMKSSDYEFSSNENLLNSLQPSGTDSLNSMSTKSSAGVSSLRTPRVKPLNTELASSYPPNLSTFTPTPQDRNRLMFASKDNSPASEPSPISHKDSSTESLKKVGYESKSEYYAYTDILQSLPKDELKTVETNPSDDFAAKQIERDNPEQSLLNMKNNIIKSIIESEAVYLDCLNTLIQYKKAFSTTTSSGDNALLSEEDLNTIFYRIPELLHLHETLLNGLKQVEHNYEKELHSYGTDGTKSSHNKLCVGELFHTLVFNISIYSDFLRNYSNSLATANRCSANNSKFSDLIKSIKVASMNGQFTNLVDLLHKPVQRLQKNAMVLYDLIEYTDPKNEEEFNYLTEALKMIQDFLHELNTVKSFRSVQDKLQRRLVKESFIVESGERRKLRHLFLFNDVIACAKYKASSKQKFTFELKWFQMLSDIVLEQSGDGKTFSTTSSTSNHSIATSSSHTTNNANSPPAKDSVNIFQTINQLKSRASALRCDVMAEEKRKNRRSVEKLRKKISELESELLLYLPQLKFSFYTKNNPNKVYTFFLSSEYERTTWIEAIKRMQLSVSLNPLNATLVSLNELQRWFDSCRKTLNLNLGSFLLRSHKDESLRFGDLYIRVKHFNGFNSNNHNNRQTNAFFVIEADSYGHFFRYAVTKYVTSEAINNINQEFLITLEGAQCLRILYYEDLKKTPKDTKEFNKEQIEKNWIFKLKSSLELTSTSLKNEFVRKDIMFNNKLGLVVEMKYVSLASVMDRIPPNKIVGNFGVNIAYVCKKEKSKVPHLISLCINEVERRGMKETGIYRVSGLASDIQRLKRFFESNSRDAFCLIREIDIHAVTGVLKLYLRELPESLFTNELYVKYLEAKDLRNPDEKDRSMTAVLSQLKEPNQSTVLALIDHLMLVNSYEEENKMSLNNLATVFGPTMLKTNTSASNKDKHSNAANAGPSSQPLGNPANPNYSLIINSDLFTASTIDVMAQADIVYFFLRRKHQGLSLTSTEAEETCL